MTQAESSMDTFGNALGDWLRDLRKELKAIRTEASSIEGLESLKLRLGAVEVETKLLETIS